MLAALLLAGCMQQMPKPVGPAPPERERGLSSGIDADRIAHARARVAVQRGKAAAPDLYHVAKADAWLDLAAAAAREEVRADTAEDALEQAEALMGIMERGRVPPLRTLHLVASRVVRGDLWEAVDQVKHSAGYACAVEPLARAEVALVSSGHKAFIGDQEGADANGVRAELLLDDARNAMHRCFDPGEAAQPESAAPPPAPVPVSTPAPASVASSRTGTPRTGSPATGRIELVQLRTDALFRFAAARLDSGASESLRELAGRIRAIPDVVSVRIHGHTDRLSRGGADVNRRLAASRARAVGRALVAQGVNAELIVETRGHGDAMPVVLCPGPRSKPTIDCLAPNRRVEIEIVRAD